MKLREIGEFGLIKRMAPKCLIRPEGVYRGIGDDCAIMDIDPDNFLLVTTDLLIERSHFRLDWTSPEDLGSKSLAVNLSDIAACGGIPRDAFISLAIPDRIEVEWFDRFYSGMMELAQKFNVNLLGGDTTESRSDLMINVALTGVVPRNQVLTRSGASAGDLVCLIGALGESAGGLRLITSGAAIKTDEQKRLIRSHLSPTPLVNEGRILAQSGLCSASIDISDGLSSDINHICAQSGVGARIAEERIPVSKDLLAVFSGSTTELTEFIFNGGEDYALLVAVKPGGLQKLQHSLALIGSRLCVIGEFTAQNQVLTVKANGEVRTLDPEGWDHFR